MTRILIAGVGNIFCGDEGFGPEMARRLRHLPWPDGVEIADFGIRGLDLADAVASGFDAVVLVDSLSRGSAPGTLYLLDVPEMPTVVRVVGCEPERVGGEQDDTMVGLSTAVTRALEPAAAMVQQLVAELATPS